MWHESYRINLDYVVADGFYPKVKWVDVKIKSNWKIASRCKASALELNYHLLERFIDKVRSRAYFS